MRIRKQLYKSITLTALLLTGLTAGSIAQDTSTTVNHETKAPAIETTTPTGNEDNVDLRSVIEIIFSSEMDETTINENTLLLHASSGNAKHKEHGEYRDDQMREQSENQYSEKNQQAQSGSVSGTISYSDKVAVFTPDEDLKKGILYTFTVTNGVKSSDNIALESDHEFSFTTSGSTDATYSDRLDNRQIERRDDRQDDRQVERRDDRQNAQNGTDRLGINRNEYIESISDTTQNGNDNRIDLGKASQFVILAKTDIHNEAGSNITGQTGEGSVADKMKKEKNDSNSASQRVPDQYDIAHHDAIWISNQRDTTSTEVSEDDSASTNVSEAIDDMMSAYSDASYLNGNDSASHNNEHFQSMVLTPGIHEWSDALHIDSDVTLSGSAEDVWLFKISDNLTVDENTVLTLTDGARAENVFWFVEGEVTIGENVEFEGIILSMNNITLEKGAKLQGRMFSQASITLDDNTVTEPTAVTGRRTSINR